MCLPILFPLFFLFGVAALSRFSRDRDGVTALSLVLAFILSDRLVGALVCGVFDGRAFFEIGLIRRAFFMGGFLGRFRFG